jgi:hypothetical protein
LPVAETCIHKLDVLFGEAEIAFRDPKTVLRSAQLHVALRQFGDRRERDAMPVLHGRQVTRSLDLRCSSTTSSSPVWMVVSTDKPTRSSTNNAHTLRPGGTSVQKPGFLTRCARACWQANQRIFQSAITDPKTGSADPAVECQVVLMMLG